MINLRWTVTLMAVHIFFFLAAESSEVRMIALNLMLVTATLALMFHSHEINIQAYRIFDEDKNVYAFEEWISDKPELGQALAYAHNLNPDDFMTFCRLLVEVRYHKDQKVLEMVSRYFRRENKK